MSYAQCLLLFKHMSYECVKMLHCRQVLFLAVAIYLLESLVPVSAFLEHSTRAELPMRLKSTTTPPHVAPPLRPRVGNKHDTSRDTLLDVRAGESQKETKVTPERGFFFDHFGFDCIIHDEEPYGIPWCMIG